MNIHIQLDQNFQVKRDSVGEKIFSRNEKKHPAQKPKIFQNSNYMGSQWSIECSI